MAPEENASISGCVLARIWMLNHRVAEVEGAKAQLICNALETFQLAFFSLIFPILRVSGIVDKTYHSLFNFEVLSSFIHETC